MPSLNIRSVIALVATLFMGVAANAAPAKSSAGELPPLVFVHGNGDDASKWIGIIWLFESNGYPAEKLYSIRFSHPSARTNNLKDEPNRSSTDDVTSELDAFVNRVLSETHAQKVALIGSSRGGMTIRNYLLHGGSKNVAYAITCGTPNHGVLSNETSNLDGEFNGKGHYLQTLNHAYGDQREVDPGVKTLTLRSDKLDKYAQPTGIAFGTPQIATGVSFEGPALAGATNIVLPSLDHRELAFSPLAFVEMYRFITGSSPKTIQVITERKPILSGLITGFEDGAFTNLPLVGVRLRIFPVGATESETPAYEITTKANGKWGPFEGSPTQEYDFDVEYRGRHVHFYKAPLQRSTNILNLRLLPPPNPSKNVESASASLPLQLLVARPEGYFSRDRDPVMIDGKTSIQEPEGLPLRDSFLVSVPYDSLVSVKLREETIKAMPSRDLNTDLRVVDFLW